MMREFIALQVDRALLAEIDALARQLRLRRHDVVRRAVTLGLQLLPKQPTLPGVHP